MQFFKQIYSANLQTIYHANLQTNILCKFSTHITLQIFKQILISFYHDFLTIYAILIEKSTSEMTLVPCHGRSFSVLLNDARAPLLSSLTPTIRPSVLLKRKLFHITTTTTKKKEHYL